MTLYAFDEQKNTKDWLTCRASQVLKMINEVYPLFHEHKLMIGVKMRVGLEIYMTVLENCSECCLKARRSWDQFLAGNLQSGVCMVSPCLCGFSPSTLAEWYKEVWLIAVSKLPTNVTGCCSLEMSALWWTGDLFQQRERPFWTWFKESISCF